jgi:hypothetical protein
MVVYDLGKNLKLPSDVDGVVPALYDLAAADDLRAALTLAVQTIRRTLESKAPPKRPSRSEIEVWEAARQFSKSIAGDW